MLFPHLLCHLNFCFQSLSPSSKSFKFSETLNKNQNFLHSQFLVDSALLSMKALLRLSFKQQLKEYLKNQVEIPPTLVTSI